MLFILFRFGIAKIGTEFYFTNNSQKKRKFFSCVLIFRAKEKGAEAPDSQNCLCEGQGLIQNIRFAEKLKSQVYRQSVQRKETHWKLFEKDFVKRSRRTSVHELPHEVKFLNL